MVEIFDDIHKIYQYKAPPTELTDYIEFFSESSYEATGRYMANQGFTVKLPIVVSKNSRDPHKKIVSDKKDIITY